MNCALCELPLQEWRLVLADEFAFATLNWEPLKPGHTMVLPRRHVGELVELTDREAGALFSLVDKVGRRLRAHYQEDVAIHLNTGAHCSQPDHLHIHVLPAQSSLRDLFVATENVQFRRRADRTELEAVCSALRSVRLD